LDLLLEQRKYLKLETALTKTPLAPDTRAFFKGVMANRRNRASDSIQLLRPLIIDLSKTNRKHAVVALSTLADDYEKIFYYAEAADTYADLAKNYVKDMSPEELGRVRKEAARWNLLRDAPPQTAIVNAPFTVQTTSNRLGLVKAPVTISGKQTSMILDTGANLSAISHSAALRWGLTLSVGESNMSGQAGKQVPVRTAVIPKLELGKAIFKNVAVIVVDDRDMFVPDIDYQLPGSLGFPVLSALGRITFFKDGRFGVGMPRSERVSVNRNLFLQRLTPIVATNIRGKEELFTIDTGATGSFFSVRYYHDFPHQFDSQFVDEVSMMGAGGSLDLPAYYLDRVTLSLGGACVHMRDVAVLIQPRGTPDDYYYGNLGQTAFDMFPSYTFDFRNMSFTIEGPACN
jgi:Aspartyl protease